MNDIYLIEHKRFLFCNGMVHIDLGYSHSTNLGWLYLTLDGVVLGANKKLEFCRLLKGFSSLYKIWRFYTNTQNFKKMMRPPRSHKLPLTPALRSVLLVESNPAQIKEICSWHRAPTQTKIVASTLQTPLCFDF